MTFFRKRPGKRPLPLGNKPAGMQLVTRVVSRTSFAPGAGERAPQSEVLGGFTPPGVLPTGFGSTGLKPFLPGKTSIKRSFQQLTARRLSPFFIATPAAVEAPSPAGFTAAPTPARPGLKGGGNPLPQILQDARAKAKATGTRVGTKFTPETIAFIKKQRMIAKKKGLA